MKSRRDFLKIAAGAGMALPLVGCGSPKPGDSKTAAPAPAKAAAAGKTLNITIRGAFAYVFNDAHSILEICSIKGSGGKCQYVEHQMGLEPSDVTTIQTELPKLRDHKGNPTVYYACPAGHLTLGGIAGSGGIAGFKKDSDEKTVKPAAAPAEWNDVVWIPNLGRAADDWRDRTVSRLRLDNGSLEIKQPTDTMSKACWEFDPPIGRPSLPMIEEVTFEVPLAGDTVTLLADGKIAATLGSVGQIVKIVIGSPGHGGKKTYKTGERVEFYAMFSELIDPSRDCRRRPVPKLGQCGGGGDDDEKQSDGEWCPSGRVVATL